MENGHDWDREQTHESLKPEVIEEAAEVIGGINILSKTGDCTNLKEELGDLLLQVVFHAEIREKEFMKKTAGEISSVVFRSNRMI